MITEPLSDNRFYYQNTFADFLFLLKTGKNILIILKIVNYHYYKDT